MKKALLCILLFVFILLLDLSTKYAAFSLLPLYKSSYVVFRDFFGISLNFTYAVNKGAAWGVFARFSSLLLAFRLGFIAFLFLYMIFKKRTSLSLTFILAGAVGNVIDFFLYGHVIDMIHFVFFSYSYPVFNVADTSICIGVIGLLAESLLEKKDHANL